MLIQGPTLCKIMQTRAFYLNRYTYKHISIYNESVARMRLLQDEQNFINPIKILLITDSNFNVYTRDRGTWIATPVYIHQAFNQSSI